MRIKIAMLIQRMVNPAKTNTSPIADTRLSENLKLLSMERGTRIRTVMGKISEKDCFKIFFKLNCLANLWTTQKEIVFALFCRN